MFLVVVFEQYCTLLYKLQRYVGRCQGRFEGLASDSKARITKRKHKVASLHFQMIEPRQSLVNLTNNSTLAKDAFQDLKIKMGNRCVVGDPAHLCDRGNIGSHLSPAGILCPQSSLNKMLPGREAEA